MSKLEKQNGFTLIELMVTISIAVILIAIAIPSFQGISLQSRQTSAINHFAALIGRARSEAVTRARSIVACASANSSSANPSCSTLNEWESGWIMFADLDLNAQFGAGDVLLQVGDPLASGVTVRGSGFTGGFTDRIIFTPGAGLLSGVTTGGGLKYCDSRGFINIRVLNVGISGQTRIATDSDADGNVEDGANQAVTVCTP